MRHLRAWFGGAVLGAAVLVSSPPMAAAQTQPNPQAEKLNDEGKQLYRQKDYAGAVRKFEEAARIAPDDPRYYFNICATYEKLGDYDRALEACDEVYLHAPDDSLKAKTGERAAAIRALKRKRGDTSGGGGDTGGGGGGGNMGGGTTGGGGGGGDTGGGGADVNAPPPDEEIERVDPGDYRWSLGIDLGPSFNRTVGTDPNTAGDTVYGRRGSGVKLHADFFIAPAANLGLQTYINLYNYFDTGSTSAPQKEFSITDLGAGLFWHRRLFGSVYVTPLVGAHFAFIQPENLIGAGESFATFGFRGDLAFHWLLGSQGQHVISFTPVSLNGYLPTAGEIGVDTTAEEEGLDHGGWTYTVGIGYTFRFKKGLPGLIVLE